jgi:hypothetical protein
MRAYLIDPELRTITEIDFAGGYKNIQEVVGCEEFTTGSRPLNGSLSKGFDAIYISDDCLDHDENLNDWFQVDAGREPSPRRGLVIGADTEGDDCDASISFEELTRRITFRGAIPQESARRRLCRAGRRRPGPIIPGRSLAEIRRSEISRLRSQTARNHNTQHHHAR